MSMVPQITNATGKSSFTILEKYTDQWGREMARVEGNYGVSLMKRVEAHKGCEFNGEIVVSCDEWADNYYCVGCNYSEYHPLGD